MLGNSLKTPLALLVALSACAREVGGPLPSPSRDASGGNQTLDAGMDGGFTIDPNAVPHLLDASADAFFVDDPPVSYCGPEAEQPDEPPVSGSRLCPSDKNRQGCPCSEAGLVAACWPGKRADRNHGVCRDGTTTCVGTDEFGLLWGPCQGYTLPVEGALEGPEACHCFSSGTWTLTNLSPCIARSKTYLYSSILTAEGKLDCGMNVPEPPPVPAAAWSQSTLKVDCAGQFKLCYTIKAGDVDNPQTGDCVIVSSCVDTWYPQAGVLQALPDLAAWSSDNTACAAQFVQTGGYGEMSVLGESIDCEDVDDGNGNAYVFHRVGYCPLGCLDTPDTPECRECRTGGSGGF